MKVVTDLFNSSVDSLKEDIISFTQKLVQTPSISGNEDNIIKLIASELEKLKYDEIFIDDAGNITGIMHGKEPDFNILYSTHADHNEPVLSDMWKYSPYSGHIEDDNLYGVASGNSKASIASQIYAGAILKRNDALNRGHYIVSFTVNECSGTCLASKVLHQNFKAKEIPVNFIVLGNATSLNIYIGQRGRAEFEMTVYGRTNRSSVPWLGLNAVHKITPVIKAIEEMIDNLPLHPMLEKSTIAITSVSTSPDSSSTIPDRCNIKIDRRFFPNEPVEEVKAQLQGIIDKIKGEDTTFKATVKNVTRTVKTYTGYEKEAEMLMLPFFNDEENPLIGKVYNELKSLQGNINLGAWYFNTEGGTLSSLFKVPVIGYAAGEEKYFNTPFEKISITNLLKSVLGNIGIYKALS